MPMYYNGGGKRSTRRGEGAGLSLPLLLALAVLALLVGASPPARVPTPRPVVSRDPGRSHPTRSPPLTLPRPIPRARAPGCYKLAADKTALRATLDATRERLREADATTTSKDRTLYDLEKMIERLKAESNARDAEAKSFERELKTTKSRLAAEVARAKERADEAREAREAARGAEAGLSECREALNEAETRAASSAFSSSSGASRTSRRAGEGEGSEARSDDAAAWSDIITDIVHPRDRYDHAPRKGTSHRLANDAAEMRGLEEAAEAEAEEEEEEEAADGGGVREEEAPKKDDAEKARRDDEALLARRAARARRRRRDAPPTKPFKVSVMRPDDEV